MLPAFRPRLANQPLFISSAKRTGRNAGQLTTYFERPLSDIADEYYVSFLLDRANRTFLAMASVAGGMEIEEVAHRDPTAILKEPFDAIAGVEARGFALAATVACGGGPKAGEQG